MRETATLVPPWRKGTTKRGKHFHPTRHAFLFSRPAVSVMMSYCKTWVRLLDGSNVTASQLVKECTYRHAVQARMVLK